MNAGHAWHDHMVGNEQAAIASLGTFARHHHQGAGSFGDHVTAVAHYHLHLRAYDLQASSAAAALWRICAAGRTSSIATAFTHLPTRNKAELLAFIHMCQLLWHVRAIGTQPVVVHVFRAISTRLILCSYSSCFLHHFLEPPPNRVQ